MRDWRGMQEMVPQDLRLTTASSGITDSDSANNYRITGASPCPPPESIETTDCVVKLDIVSQDGSLVEYTKDQTVRCLQGVSKGYMESFSPDGTIDNFYTDPGEIGLHYREAGHVYIPISYENPLHTGDELKRQFKCDWHNSFCDSIEYWEQRQHHPSANISIQVIFPSSRSPNKYWVEHRHGSVLKADHLEALVRNDQGRTVLEVFIPNPIYLHSYLLKWQW